jgi:hypothetical protein
MEKGHLPQSEFLNAVIAETAPLSGCPEGDENLQRLIELTRDADKSNRDWATFLLSQEQIDTVEVRRVLLEATVDEDQMVRAEAILGLARISPELALPLVQQALAEASVSVPIFEAAELLAHPSLIDDLRGFTDPSDHSYADFAAIEALHACEEAKLPK